MLSWHRSVDRQYANVEPSCYVGEPPSAHTSGTAARLSVLVYEVQYVPDI